LNPDIQTLDLLLQLATADVEREFGAVLEICLSRRPPVFIRTSDGLHFASAKTAGEIESITADQRQRAAALLMGLRCCLATESGRLLRRALPPGRSPCVTPL